MSLASADTAAADANGNGKRLESLPNGEASTSPAAVDQDAVDIAGTPPQIQAMPALEHPTERSADAIEGTLPQASQSSLAGASATSIPLVSLGCNCGPKGAFQQMGYGAEYLPFDWMSTTLEGAIKFISTDFEGFFDFQSVADHSVSGVNITHYRSHCHSFWHDDLNDPAEVAKYERRIKRFCEISASNDPVIFVRMAASMDEIGQIDQLSSLLKQKFGPRALLLLILDLQGSNPLGPCTVAGLDDILLYYVPTQSGGYEKYGPALNAALAWAAGQATNFTELENLAFACAVAEETNWGHFGLGGIPAFEGSGPPQGAQQQVMPMVQMVEKIATVPQIQLSETVILAVGDRVETMHEGKWYDATVCELYENRQVMVHCDVDEPGVNVKGPVEGVRKVEKIATVPQIQLSETVILAVGDRVETILEGQWYDATVCELYENQHVKVHCDVDEPGVNVIGPVEGLRKVEKIATVPQIQLSETVILAVGDRVETMHEGQWYDATVCELYENRQVKVHCDVDEPDVNVIGPVEGLRKAEVQRSPSPSAVTTPGSNASAAAGLRRGSSANLRRCASAPVPPTPKRSEPAAGNLPRLTSGVPWQPSEGIAAATLDAKAAQRSPQAAAPTPEWSFGRDLTLAALAFTAKIESSSSSCPRVASRTAVSSSEGCRFAKASTSRTLEPAPVLPLSRGARALCGLKAGANGNVSAQTSTASGKSTAPNSSPRSSQLSLRSGSRPLVHKPGPAVRQLSSWPWLLDEEQFPNDEAAAVVAEKIASTIVAPRGTSTVARHPSAPTIAAPRLPRTLARAPLSGPDSPRSTCTAATPVVGTPARQLRPASLQAPLSPAVEAYQGLRSHVASAEDAYQNLKSSSVNAASVIERSHGLPQEAAAIAAETISSTIVATTGACTMGGSFVASSLTAPASLQGSFVAGAIKRSASSLIAPASPRAATTVVGAYPAIPAPAPLQARSFVAGSLTRTASSLAAPHRRTSVSPRPTSRPGTVSLPVMAPSAVI